MSASLGSPVEFEVQLEHALADADVRVLLMCLVHLTGDRRWMNEPYLPKRDVRLIADTEAGFPEEIATEIRQAVRSLVAASLLSGERPPTAIDDPGDQLLSEMLDVCLGEKVAPEYVPMMRAEMGFTPSSTQWPESDQTESDQTEAHHPDLSTRSAVNVLIVGAGLSGLGLAYQLGQLGIPYLIVEKNEEVGGTWFENRYPGCAVDTPNHFYSYSFAPNHGWQHYFSPRNELQSYVEHFATEQDIRPNIRFGTELIAARWDDATKRWCATVRSAEGEEVLEAAVFVTAIGHFNKPLVAAFAGAEKFAGTMFHSARWPDSLDLTGKRVAIVGTGASSMQIVPTIADVVSELTIYQRSAQWARPVAELNDKVKPGTEWLLRNLPYYAEWNRFTLFWRYGDGLLRFLKKDPDWPHPERSLNRVNDRHRIEMADHITNSLASRPELIEKCMPTYPPYGKRILLDKGWFETLLRPHVELVTDAIDHVDSDGVVTVDGTHRTADVVVVATGFEVTDLAARLDITGRNGVRLADDWADDNPRAYLGITVPQFPNFFCMYGPNTNAGHGGSAIFLGECQTRYITSCVVDMIVRRQASLEVRPDVRDEYVERVDAEHETLVWTHPGMSTYYRNKHGRVVSPMPFRLVDYWASTRAHDPHDFRWEPMS